jgi:hypothetical protein
MRYSTSDKTEIIRPVEQSPWPARRTLKRHRHVNELGVGEQLNADHVDFP